MAELMTQLVVRTPDEVGMLEKVSGAVAQKEVNIQAVAAYGQEGKAAFYLITSDNEKAKEAIREAGYEVEEEEVVVVEMADEAGKLKEIATKIAQAGINLSYIYGSVSKEANSALLILNSRDNQKLLEIL